MKKLTALLLTVSMVVSLTACSSGGTSGTTAASPAGEAAVVPDVPPEEQAVRDTTMETVNNRAVNFFILFPPGFFI